MVGGEEEVVMNIYELQQLWQEGRAAPAPVDSNNEYIGHRQNPSRNDGYWFRWLGLVKSTNHSAVQVLNSV